MLTLVSWGVVSCASLMAQNAPVSTVGVVSSYGTTATVSVSASNINNIGSFSIKILYDQAVVHPAAVTASPLIGGSLSVNLNNPGVIFLSWFTYPGITLAGNPVILNIDFTRMAFGTSALTWFDDGYSCAWYDGNSTTLADTPTGNYYINGSLSFYSPDAPHAILPTIHACQGTAVSVPVTVTGFTSIGKTALRLDYNPAALSYQNFTNTSGFPGLTVDATLPGKLIISGIIPSGGSGFSIADSATLLTMNFNYLEGAATLVWFDDGVSCQYFGSPPSFFLLNDAPQSVYYLNGSVIQNPLPAVAGAINGPSGGNVCAGETGVNFSVAPIPDADTYAWSLPPGAVITSGASTNNITVAFGSAPGNGDMTVSGGNQCGTGPASPVFQVYVSSPPSITVQPVSPATVNAGEGSASFTVEASGSFLTYQWQEFSTSWTNLVNDSIHSGVFSTEMTITNPPLSMNGYRYRCIVTGFCLPQAISDGDASLSVSNLTGIEIMEQNATGNNSIAMNIHPNPAVTETTLTCFLPDQGTVLIELWNIFGKKEDIIYHGTQTGGIHTFKYPVRTRAGLYIITLSLQTGLNTYKSTKKLILR
jgi:hypothetical protein